MENLNQFFIDYGYYGMAMAAFLAGTFVPFSSEAVMVALLVTTRMDPSLTVASATVGNVAGTMANYYIGRTCSISTICKWLHLKEARLHKTSNYVERHGSWIALFTFLPAFGTAIAVALGILRTNAFKVMGYSTVGKLARYIMFAYTALAFK